MTSTIDLKILETLSSKICHDLVNPISAINNGVELLEDSSNDGNFSKEAIKMVEFSGDQASKRLQIFRYAYGQLLSGTGTPLTKIVETINSFLSSSRISVEFPINFAASPLMKKDGFLRLLINAVLFSFEIMQIAGTITVQDDISVDGEALSLHIFGKHKDINAEILSGLQGRSNANDVSVQSITAYLLGCYARQHGATVALEVTDEINMTLKLTMQEQNIVSSTQLN